MDSGMQPDPESENGSNQVEVPLESVAIDGKTPQVGDTVDFAIEARVVSVDDDMATVVPTKVNGQSVSDEENESGEDESSGEGQPSFNQGGDYQQPQM